MCLTLAVRLADKPLPTRDVGIDNQMDSGWDRGLRFSLTLVFTKGRQFNFCLAGISTMNRLAVVSKCFLHEPFGVGEKCKALECLRNAKVTFGHHLKGPGNLINSERAGLAKELDDVVASLSVNLVDGNFKS